MICSEITMSPCLFVVVHLVPWLPTLGIIRSTHSYSLLHFFIQFCHNAPENTTQASTDK